MDALAGTSTFRSFIKNTDPVNTADQALNLSFGAGEPAITYANPAQSFRASYRSAAMR